VRTTSDEAEGLMDRTDTNTWIAPIIWGAATIVLIVITFTLDPLWSYYGSWAAGMMTFVSGFKVARSQDEERRLDSEDEVLQLEVRKAKRENQLRAGADTERRMPPQDGDATSRDVR
jgi:hypothetical protein